MSGTCKDCASWFGKEGEPLGECAMVGASTRIPEREQPVIVIEKPVAARFFTPPRYGCERFVRMGEARKPEEKPGSAMIHGKPVEVVTVVNDAGRGDVLLKVDGEIVPYQRRVVVDSDMDETTIEVELWHPPTNGDIHISGYLIDEADWKRLQEAKGVDHR